MDEKLWKLELSRKVSQCSALDYHLKHTLVEAPNASFAEP
jgi:hypothetical protein